jgi:hypothetical protein
METSKTALTPINSMPTTISPVGVQKGVKTTANISQAHATQDHTAVHLDPLLVQALVDAGLLTIHQMDGRPHFDEVELALLHSRLS